ncbi:Rhomboid protease GluP [Andreprevotia sp. IGB-42]|uniref:rhomboid family intramembrane serine protease n=1 Tax=Andreprevotia sp. IGB-42 TaxID=2497473 RepID=UPI0013578F74|nr:rhomboid family intramembrane serine protease [Andreprevotia sp. IGB-42]KAF0811941.1 Rhomboid protease GluP [Andreprevotia sp. IGB-42]
MLLLPLPAQPDWRRPPWITLFLIVACCFIYFGLQFNDDARREAAFAAYRDAGLHELEVPLYLKDLEKRGKSRLANELGRDVEKKWPLTVIALQADTDFQRRLAADEVITLQTVGHDAWRANRHQFEALYKQIFTEKYALRASDPKPVALFMHMFMHGSVMHLAGNMIILFIVGYTVEMALGAGLFLAFYLLAGLGATIPDFLGSAPPYMLSLGASGAIAGVMAMFVVLYGRRKIRFFYWVLVYFSTVTAPALLVLPLWLLKEAVMNSSDAESHVNYMAHFAGLLTGALLVAAYRWQRGGRSADKVVLDEKARQNDAQRKEAEKWSAALDFERAAKVYAAMSDAQPDDAGLAADFYKSARLQTETGLRHRATLRVMLLAAHGHKALMHESADAWLWLLKQRLAVPRLTLPQWLKLAAGWLDCGNAASCDALLQMLLKRAADQPALPALLYRTGRVYRDQGEPGKAKSCWRLLLQHYPKATEVQWVMADPAFKP